MIALIKEGLRVIAEALGLINRRTDLKNAADVKEAAKAQQKVDRRTEIENAIEKRDESAIKNILAE